MALFANDVAKRSNPAAIERVIAFERDLEETQRSKSRSEKSPPRFFIGITKLFDFKRKKERKRESERERERAEDKPFSFFCSSIQPRVITCANADQSRI